MKDDPLGVSGAVQAHGDLDGAVGADLVGVVGAKVGFALLGGDLGRRDGSSDCAVHVAAAAFHVADLAGADVEGAFDEDHRRGGGDGRLGDGVRVVV